MLLLLNNMREFVSEQASRTVTRQWCGARHVDGFLGRERICLDRGGVRIDMCTALEVDTLRSGTRDRGNRCTHVSGNCL